MNDDRFPRARRGLLAAGLVSAPVLLALAILHACPVPRCPVLTEEICGKVRPGMTRAEVEEVVGGPPFEYPGPCRYGVWRCQGATCAVFDNFKRGTRAVAPGEARPSSPGGSVAVWQGEEYALGVEYDEGGRVVGVGVGWAYREPGLVDEVRAWFGW